MSSKSINEVAVEAALGLYGEGIERDTIIRSFGYNPKMVQKIINKSLKYGLPNRDVVLGASDKTAVTSDGTEVTYSDIWDLAYKLINYFERDDKKKLSDLEKYVTTSYEDNDGVARFTKLYYGDVVSNGTRGSGGSSSNSNGSSSSSNSSSSNSSNSATMQNGNNPSWSNYNPTSRANYYTQETWTTADKANRERDLEGLSALYNKGEARGDTIKSITYANGTNNVLPSISFYIKNMLNDKTIYLPVYPEETSESFSTNYSQTDLNGRSAPYQTYGGNEARTISLSATLHQDLCTEKTGSLQTIVMYLKQLVYPRYNGSIVIPPYCYVKFGDMISCYAIMDSIDFSWGDTIIEDSNVFSKCEVNFSFQELRRSSLPTVDNVFSGGKDSSS